MSSKLIVALDFDNKSEALNLVDQLDSNSCILKVGSELFTLLGPTFVTLLIDKGFKVFLDLKFHDIPNTVAKACKTAADLGVWMMNVHASGGLAMMEAAVDALTVYKNDKPILIAVTVLTSFKEEHLVDIGVHSSLNSQVEGLAQLAKKAGLDGVVCSALEVKKTKANCGVNFITVTPGIRLANSSIDDQSRIMTPEQAIKQGSDYLVVGRPITRALDPNRVIQDILLSLQ